MLNRPDLVDAVLCEYRTKQRALWNWRVARGGLMRPLIDLAMSLAVALIVILFPPRDWV